MTDSQLDAIIDGVAAAGADPTRVEWPDLRNAIKAVYQNQTSLTDLGVNNDLMFAFPKRNAEGWTLSTLSAPMGVKVPANNGIWGLGHVMTPEISFDGAPGTGFMAGRFGNTSAPMSQHNGIDFISNGRRMACMYTQPEGATGDPAVVVLHGYGTNRFKIDSESNIVFVSATGRYEFESRIPVARVVYFFGYTAGSAFSSTICFVNEDNAQWAKAPLSAQSFRGFNAFEVWEPVAGSQNVLGGFTDRGHPFLPTTTYVNDAAAAAAGVRVGGLYWNGTTITQRRV